MHFYPKYYTKTLLYGVAPMSFSHVRELKKEQNKNYKHERDKHPVRDKHNGKSGWASDSGEVKKREYASYDEYVTHQKQKFEEITQMHGGFSNKTIVTFRQRFYRRFRHLPELLKPDAKILCLGARQGTEVEVLRDIGFHGAYGIDLNPGRNNPFVIPGDFMNLSEPENSIDCIYTNSLDHAFDLDKFLAEHIRVLKPNGLALYDLPRYSGSRNPGAFEAIGWDSEETIIKKISQSYHEKLKAKREKKWQWLLFKGPKK